MGATARRAANEPGLTIETTTPTIGSEVRGLDLAAPISEEVADKLRRILAERQVLIFRDQPIDPEQHVAVARIFGNPDGAKTYFPLSDAHPLLEVIETRPGGTRYTTDQWHVDVSYLAEPPRGAVLHARVLPPSGGDTLWSSATAAYDALPSGLAAYLEGLTALHSIEKSAWPRIILAQENGEARYREIRARQIPVSHPLVRRHPVTGRKVLFVNPKYVDRIEGVSRGESDALLTFLFGLIERPEFQLRLRWEPNTIAVWDNWATTHYAVADYGGAHRLMHRVTF